MSRYVLYNPLSNSGHGLEVTQKLEELLGDKNLEYVNVVDIDDKDMFIQELPEDAEIILSGGDGTLNYYVNHTTEETRKRKIGYYATGTGNDFIRDLPFVDGDYIEDVSPFLVGLPTATVNGKDYLFLNGIGFGIDGYCCEMGDKIRAKSDKPVNYTAIAVKGVLFKFRPVTATLTVDGKTRTIKKAWMVPAMNGRFYGGGMMATPKQERLSSPRTLTTMIFHCGSRLRTLMVFPRIFTGDHIGNSIVDVESGKCITVKFNRPCALQVDGETISNVTEYTARVAEGV